MLFIIFTLTVAIEFFTVILRLWFGPITAQPWMRHVVHVHHGAVGVLLIGIYFFVPQSLFVIFGVALFFSDALHHFVVIPIFFK